jgi:hypothetical protein
MKITNVAEAGLFIDAETTNLKCCGVGEHLDHLLNGTIKTERCKVMEVVSMTSAEYRQFMGDLMTDREWLAGKGGCESYADGLPPDGTPWREYTPAQQDIFRWTAYELVIAVSSPGFPTIYVNPQGYNYARNIYIHMRSYAAPKQGWTRI